MSRPSKSYVSKRSKRGVFVFIAIAILVVYIPRILLNVFPSKDFVVKSSVIKELEENSKKKYSQFNFFHSKKQKRAYKIPPAKFDPNQYTKRQWMYLGLSTKQADVVLKFTERGIYSNEQLKKIFVIPEDLYALIEDSTFYPERKINFATENNKLSYKKEKILIELNSADQEKLESIPGVGSFYAKNILKYRERLGGFISKEQLLEVWKMDVEKYDLIEKYVEVDSKNISMLNINSATAEELKTHPYLNWNIANSIVKIRNKKKSFTKIEDIRESVLIDEELFEKIKPYLIL